MSRKEYKTAKIESQNTFVCERAIFEVLNSFTVKKVNFLTINVKFKVILSSKSVGGGGYLYSPSPTQKVGDTPHPPGIYASDLNKFKF